MRQLILAIISIALFTHCNSNQEMAQWRGPNRDGIYPEKNLLTQWPDSGLVLLWKFDSLGTGYASAAVISSRVYTIGTIDSISYVFSFSTKGDLLWRKSIGKEWTKSWPGCRSTPVIYNGLGYVQNGFGIVFCFNPSNGDIVWSRDIVKDYKGSLLTFGQCENLLVDGDKVFCTPAGIDADVVALNRKTGEELWKTSGSNDSTSYASPILIQVGGKTFFVNLTSKKVVAVNVETGEVAWTYKLKGSPFPNTPIFKDGFLFTVDAYKAGSFMLKISNDGKNVSEVWRNPNIWPQQGDAILLGDRMYTLGGNGKTYSCVDWKTGNEIYTDSTKVQVVNFVSAEGLLYCYELRGGGVKLLRPTPNGFEKLGSFKIKGGTPQLHCSHPVIKDGRLYIRHDNSLFVYDIAKK